MHHKHTIHTLSIVVIILAVIVVSLYFGSEIYTRVTTTLPEIKQLVSGNLKSAKTSVSAPDPLRSNDNSNNPYMTIAGVIKITNMQRYNYGLPPLKESLLLDQSADIKLKDMFTNQYFEHISPSKVGIDDLAKIVGYKYIAMGENLALGNFKNDDALVQAWMNSPGHRANILNKKYTEIGVSVGQGTYQGHSNWMAVQHFGQPLSACPAPDESLKVKIGSLTSQINAIYQALTAKKSEIENLSYSEDYGTKVNDYNQLVSQYNNLSNQVVSLVTTYNNQIETFNRCAGD